uniref:Uncharacterized protein n=1 Tax=Pristionchus pacificus TaxID=54126 RepID=A0A2A6CQ74_PRIPA|eukprot:PDM80193.1 hypothetical protein PRIPAC_32772 [Pristionchus pacificus]
MKRAASTIRLKAALDVVSSSEEVSCTIGNTIEKSITVTTCHHIPLLCMHCQSIEERNEYGVAPIEPPFDAQDRFVLVGEVEQLSPLIFVHARKRLIAVVIFRILYHLRERQATSMLTILFPRVLRTDIK